MAALLLWGPEDLEPVLFRSFLVGNALYYGVGILLAVRLRDNRAFCKYLCPVTVFLKPMSYFSLLRVKNDTDKCLSCGRCRRVCPMDVDVCSNARNRENATECILCLRCVEECPARSLHL